MFNRDFILLKHLVILLVFSYTPLGAVSQQTDYITGRVTDSETHEPLPFVNIIYNDEGQGVVSDLEGNFRIHLTQNIDFLEFRYIGYGQKRLSAVDLQMQKNILVELRRITYDINEVAIYPVENPAHRIIDLASENRLSNHPERTGPFSYISYEKMIFTLDPDSTSADSTTGPAGNLPDSVRYGRNLESTIDVQRFIDKQHLFMMESLSSRKFLAPDRDKEEIIASKVSGISQPTFAILARQFQSFSFYDNFISIANKQYLNPISSGSTDKYFFLIQDTVFTERLDTVFIISFRPRDNKNFEGMEGILYINSSGYAIQNVIARGSGQQNELFDISIQQQYDQINDIRWFPVSLNTTIILNNTQIPGQSGPVRILGMGTSSITNVNIDPDIEKNEFDEVQIEVNPNAHRQPEELWNTYRTDSLNAREIETYRVIDSIGKAQHLDRTITSFETLLTGYLPGRYISLDIRRFIDYNRYEGFRFGAGGHTTENISKIFALDGYVAYSLKDKAFKYGAGITFNIWPDHEIDIHLMYRHDVAESGGVDYHEIWSLESSSFIRDYMIQVMDIADEAEVALGFRMFKFMTGKIYLRRSQVNPTNDYGYIISDLNPQITLTRFDYTETGFQLRYAYNERYMKTPRGNKFSLGTNYPILYLNFAKGLTWWGGGYSYYRSEFKLTKTFRTKSFGETRIVLKAGMVTSDVPYSKLYAGDGSYRKFTVETEASFGTMRLNEFLSDRFFSVFIKHDFGNLLFRPAGRFQPEIALVHNLGFGMLSQKDLHENIAFTTYEKGYFETGLLINNIFRIQPLQYGLGVLYRYGPYTFNKTIDNFAFKLTLQFNI